MYGGFDDQELLILRRYSVAAVDLQIQRLRRVTGYNDIVTLYFQNRCLPASYQTTAGHLTLVPIFTAGNGTDKGLHRKGPAGKGRVTPAAQLQFDRGTDAGFLTGFHTFRVNNNSKCSALQPALQHAAQDMCRVAQAAPAGVVGGVRNDHRPLARLQGEIKGFIQCRIILTELSHIPADSLFHLRGDRLGKVFIIVGNHQNRHSHLLNIRREEAVRKAYLKDTGLRL